MEPAPRTVVAVRPRAALDDRPRLFAALTEAFALTFVPWAPAVDAAAVIEIADDGVLPTSAELATHGVPALAIAGAGDADAEEVLLGPQEAVDRRMRSIVLHDRLAAPVPAGADDEVLATGARSGPAWTATRQGAALHRVGAVLPELATDEVLYALLSRRAIAMVALIHFLRPLEPAGATPQPAPLRASILFDDPNLRWRSYGFIDYRRLLEHADAHGYHAAMAMVPLDAGRAHAGAVDLYARRPDRLSLVFHGNDHVDNELLSASAQETALRTAAQAVRRVEAFERRCGLRVERIMTPPHGLCSPAMTRALGNVGFDGLCAIHPRPWTAERPSDPLLAGWRPAEFVHGCAIIPRIPFTSSDADIALRAFLDHPLVIYGHHEDVADGLEPLADIAARVHRVCGAVSWTSVGTIARSNYAMARRGAAASIAPYARRVCVEVPAGVETVQVERPEDHAGDGALTGWTGADGTRTAFGEPVAVGADRRVDLRLTGRTDVDPAGVPAPAWRPWPKLRRAATEVRDRASALRPARA